MKLLVCPKLMPKLMHRRLHPAEAPGAAAGSPVTAFAPPTSHARGAI